MKRPLTMQETIKKFTKYATTVERDLEMLIFSMLDLIDSKTKTLRKLIKLHLHIKKAKLVADIKYKNNISIMSKSQLDDSIDDSYDQTTTMSHISLNKFNHETGREIYDKKAGTVTKDSDTILGYMQGKEIFLREKISDTFISNSETTKNKESDEIIVFPGKMNLQNVCSFGDVLQIEKQVEVNSIALNLNKKVDANVEVNMEKLAYEALEITNENQDLSSFSSYCVSSHLEGALNALQECEIGDAGVFLDANSFRNIVCMLETVLRSCETSTNGHCGTQKSKMFMNRCSTQPSLKGKYEELPKRKTYSATDCNNRNCKKNKIRI